MGKLYTEISWPNRGFSTQDLETLKTQGVTSIDGIDLQPDGSFSAARIHFASDQVMQSYVAYIASLAGVEAEEA